MGFITSQPWVSHGDSPPGMVVEGDMGLAGGRESGGGSAADSVSQPG